MNQLPENSLRIYDVTLVTSYLIGLKFDLIYCHWNSREPGAFPNISFPMFYNDNSVSCY